MNNKFNLTEEEFESDIYNATKKHEFTEIKDACELVDSIKRK